MDYFLKKYVNNVDSYTFQKDFGFDPIIWGMPIKPDEKKGEYLDNDILCNDNWRLKVTEISGESLPTKRFTFITPEKELSTVMQYNEHTLWNTEHLIKDKSDIDIIAKYCPHPQCDIDIINKIADDAGDNALIRGFITPFRPWGQPGCWQDIACLFGIERLILEAFDDPEWVTHACQTVQEMKKTFIRSLKGARYDILELGGGDASTTVISPDMFQKFVVPFDEPLIQLAHDVGHKVVYHTCGGMMPILEQIADMGVDGLETLTPHSMGGDADLAEAKRRIGDKVCMIGGFDQGRFFWNCTEEETRREVRRCFKDAGQNGGFILATSDHFFDAEPELIRAFTDEAHKCLY
jgi:hypothetical protein